MIKHTFKMLRCSYIFSSFFNMLERVKLFRISRNNWCDASTTSEHNKFYKLKFFDFTNSGQILCCESLWFSSIYFLPKALSYLNKIIKEANLILSIKGRCMEMTFGLNIIYMNQN